MTVSTELEAEHLRIIREIHRLNWSFGGSPDDPLTGQLGQFVAAVGSLEKLTAATTATSAACAAWEARLSVVLEKLETLYTTARPALEESVRLLSDLSELIGADERRRAGDAAEEARRRKLDSEVQRLSAAEDAAEKAARRKRLETQARKQLTGKAS